MKSISCQSKRCTRVAATAVPACAPPAPQASCAQGSRLESTIPSKLPPSLSRTACTMQIALPGIQSAGRCIPYGFQYFFSNEHHVSRNIAFCLLAAEYEMQQVSRSSDDKCAKLWLQTYATCHATGPPLTDSPTSIPSMGALYVRSHILHVRRHFT